MNEFELALCASMLRILPELLNDRPHGLYELAQECSVYLKQPVCEIMNPLSVALREMLRNGILSYDRATNRIRLGNPVAELS
jgi:hypothetical protein